MHSSLYPSPLPSYQRAWKLLSQFLHVILPSVSTTLPISSPVLALLIAYVCDRYYAPLALNTYVSALGYCHKPLGFPHPTRAFCIVQMLKGYRKVGSRLDSRLPITLPIPNRILESSIEICASCGGRCCLLPQSYSTLILVTCKGNSFHQFRVTW